MTREMPCPTHGRRQISVETTTYLRISRIAFMSRPKLPDALIVQVFDGKRAWVKDPRGTSRCPTRWFASFELGSGATPIAVLLAAHDGTVRSRLLARRQGRGGPAPPRARAVGRRSRSDGAAHRPRDKPDREADVRGRSGPGSRSSKSCSRLPAGGRRADRVPRGGAARRAAHPRAAVVELQINAPLDPRCSNGPPPS